MIPLDKMLDLIPKRLLDQLAVGYRVNKVNQVRLKGQLVFVCLLNCLVNHPKLTQRLLEETYRQLNDQTADHSSFGKRLASLNPDYFEAIFRHVYSRVQSRITSGDRQALRLRIADATTVVLSAKLMAFGILVGSGGSAGPNRVKRHAKSVLTLSEEGLPDFLHLCNEQCQANDNPGLGDPIIAATQPGDLWLFDAGVYDRDRLKAIHDLRAFFLVPHRDQLFRVQRVLWEAPVSSDTEGETPSEPSPPTSGKKGPRAVPPCRLLRVELAVFENGTDRKSATNQAKWGQMPLLVLHAQRWDVRTQQWKPWVLLTNLPLNADCRQAGPYTFAEVLELYRRRWEIETFFKFLKQHLSYSHLVSRSENGIRVVIWMALITAVMLIWYKEESGIDRGWRSVKFWLAEDVREWTGEMLGSGKWLQIVEGSG